MRTLNITFDDKEFKKLSNAKEEAKILGIADSWEDYILKQCGIRKIEYIKRHTKLARIRK